MSNSILIALNDSVASRSALNFFVRMALCPDDCEITLLHILRKPTATEELMGKKFTAEQPARFAALLEKAKDKLVEAGYHPKRIETLLVTDPYPTVSEAIIDQCRKRHFDMVIIGRKRMTKAEEFVMGDVSVKLLREMDKMAILVVRSD
ncbi:MAG: universal stress protein [Deltaproteobacteria bacterium]|nr:universal stress protein [Deltaproteobacteria bacterium]